MKAQMRFQKYLCLAMLIWGAVTLLYAFCYCSGALAELGQNINVSASGTHTSRFTASEGLYDALLYDDIQSFNNLLMFVGVAMVLLAVILYITSCNKRRNYYISNYVSVGVVAGGSFVLSLVALVMNAIWRSRFLSVDFTAWKAYQDLKAEQYPDLWTVHYNGSTAWFDLGFAVYIIMMVLAVLLILNLVWKIKLMQGEKKLLLGNGVLAGGAV